MTQPYIAYEGRVCTSLGPMLREYVPIFTAGINRRVGLEGTMQRGPYTPEGAHSWLDALEKSRGKDEVLAVLRHVEGASGLEYQYIGHMGLHGITWPAGRGVSGSMFFDSRSKGHGTEAKLLLLYHAFEVLSLHKVCSTVLAFNAQSLGHLIKCGYRIVGRRKDNDMRNGVYVDEIMLEVFRDEWLPIWKRYQETCTLPSLTSEERELVGRESGM